MPSLRSSPWIRGAPQSGLARLISRINWRISSGTLGLPTRERDFHRQNKRNPAQCQRMNHQGVQNVGCDPIEARKNEAIEIAENKPPWRFSSQHIKLAAQRHDLRLERGARPE